MQELEQRTQDAERRAHSAEEKVPTRTINSSSFTACCNKLDNDINHRHKLLSPIFRCECLSMQLNVTMLVFRPSVQVVVYVSSRISQAVFVRVLFVQDFLLGDL